MIWNREQYIAHCHYEFTGREMFCELFGPLIGLEDEWRRQKLCKQSATIPLPLDYPVKTMED